jgi:hypothetical protein
MNLEVLCGDDFPSLKVYFQDETLDNIARLGLDEDDLMAMAEPKDRIKMLRFWRERVRPLLPGKAAPNWTAIHALRLPSMGPPKLKIEKSLNLSKQVNGIVTKGFSATKFDIDELVVLLGKSECREIVEAVDLTWCDLTDGDVTHVSNIVTLLPNCSVVKLAWNRISGLEARDRVPVVDTPLLAMLSQEKIRQLWIVGNGVASMVRKDFLAKLNDHQLRKLIWIPDEWLDAVHWKNMIRPEQIQAVIEAHQTAYGIDEVIELKWVNHNERNQVCNLLSNLLPAHEDIVAAVRGSLSPSFVRVKIARFQYSVNGQTEIKGNMTMSEIVTLRKIRNVNSSA